MRQKVVESLIPFRHLHSPRLLRQRPPGASGVLKSGTSVWRQPDSSGSPDMNPTHTRHAKLPKSARSLGRGAPRAGRSCGGPRELLASIHSFHFQLPSGTPARATNRRARDEETPRRRFQTLVATADQDGCRSEGESGKKVEKVPCHRGFLRINQPRVLLFKRWRIA